MASENKEMGCGGLVFALLAGALLTGGWISINGMILFDRLLFTALPDSPLLAWTVAGATFGTIAVSGKMLRRHNKPTLFNLFTVLLVVAILALAAINWQRTERFMPTTGKKIIIPKGS
ncbi:MAG: hypothetical protein WCP20_23330 [Desulfuromonadales bacterium]